MLPIIVLILKRNLKRLQIIYRGNWTFLISIIDQNLISITDLNDYIALYPIPSQIPELARITFNERSSRDDPNPTLVDNVTRQVVVSR